MKMKKYLGIDVGGTSAKYAIISQDGDKSSMGAFPTGAGIERDKFIELIHEVIRQALKEDICGVGISTLGIVNSDTGEILGGVENMPALKNVNLKVEIEKRYPMLNVDVYNDVKAVALGERWLGAAKGCDNFFCITLGTGLGGCAFVNSEILGGAHNRAGEICYLNYISDTDYCEHYLSTRYVMDKAAKKLGIERINGIDFFDLVREGNLACLEVLNEWVEGIARLISNIIFFFDPEKVIIGGGISTEEEQLLYPIREKLNSMLPPEFRDETEVVMAQCANGAGMLGAVSGFVNASDHIERKGVS